MPSALPATAPVDLVMPADAQLWMNILNWGLVAVVLVFALNYWRQHGSAIGIWLLLGGAFVTFNEPIVDILGKCWFPAIGSWPFIKAWGVTVPIHMVPVYMWYVGGQAFLCYALFRRGITQRGGYALYAGFGVANILLEVPGLNLATPMYSYFGNQPLVFMKFPLWWMFCNALMPMVIAGFVFRFEGLLQGARRVLIVPLSWMAAAATNGLVAAPIWVALNAEGSNMLWTHLAAALSLVMGLMVCRGLGVTVATDAPQEKNRSGMAAA